MYTINDNRGRNFLLIENDITLIRDKHKIGPLMRSANISREMEWQCLSLQFNGFGLFSYRYIPEKISF